jgi:hypothetical protein
MLYHKNTFYLFHLSVEANHLWHRLERIQPRYFH